MLISELESAKQPTFYFVGVSTAHSSIMRIFPQWIQYLGLSNIQIKGIDCKIHDEADVYRRIVSFIKQDEYSLGGLVTTHKMDLLAAARSYFDYLDPYAQLLDEVSSISKRERQLRGHAKDPITSGLAMEALVQQDYWRDTNAELCILGAGGSSLALTCYLMMQKTVDDLPSKIVVTNRSEARLIHMKKIHDRINPGVPVEYIIASEASINDAVVCGLRPGSLVVNATGLGKDREGSPLTDNVQFPDHGIVWEFNYRGNLIFLEQARRQASSRSLRIEDGWRYFINGWLSVIAEVLQIDLPLSGQLYDELSAIASQYR